MSKKKLSNKTPLLGKKKIRCLTYNLIIIIIIYYLFNHYLHIYIIYLII